MKHQWLQRQSRTDQLQLGGLSWYSQLVIAKLSTVLAENVDPNPIAYTWT